MSSTREISGWRSKAGAAAAGRLAAGSRESLPRGPRWFKPVVLRPPLRTVLRRLFFVAMSLEWSESPRFGRSRQANKIGFTLNIYLICWTDDRRVLFNDR